jgi:ubiquinone biosynthesis protein
MLRRIIKIVYVILKYNLIISIIGFYRKRGWTHESMCEPPKGWEREGEKLRKALTELGPTFIKFGQLLSKRPDIVPPPIIAELQKLQGDVKPTPFEEIRKYKDFVCTCEFGKKNPRCYRCNDITEIFDEFDEEPVASASIAQVYRAKIGDSDVAVKVLRPKVERIIRTDLNLLGIFLPLGAKLLRAKGFDAKDFLNELSTMLMGELDMRREALHIERFRHIFREWDSVKIPKVFWEYTTKDVLVMEFVEGEEVSSHPTLSKDEARKYANLIAKSFLKMVYIDGFFHADPHSANILILGDRIAYLDFGAVGRLREDLKIDSFEMFYAVYKEDTEKAVNTLLRLAGVSGKDVDMNSLYSDVDELIMKFHVGKYEKSQSENFARIALKYGLQLPKPFILLERAILLVEGVCHELYPEFDLKESIGELFDDEKVLKDEIKRSVKSLADAWRRIIYETPEIIETYKSLAVPQERSYRKGGLLFSLILLAVSAFYMSIEPVVGTVGVVGSIIIALMSIR